MANVKNYGISGVSGSVELGKAGPKVEHSSGGNVDIKDTSDVYTHVSGADGVAADNFVTRRQYDVLDDIIDKLVPEQPPFFADDVNLTNSNLTGSSVLLASGTITDNTSGGTIPVTSAGASVSSYRQTASTVSTASSQNTDVGPGDTGTIAIITNGSQAAALTFTSATGQSINSNGLFVNDNVDYPAGTPGFWQSFDARISGAAISNGWSRYQLTHTATGTTDTNELYVLRDSLSATPGMAGTLSFTEDSAGTTADSSGVPHYQNSAVFRVSGLTQTNLSGFTYYGGNDPLEISDSQSDDDSIIGSAIDKSYTDLGVSTPLAAGTTSATSLNDITFSPNDSNNHGTNVNSVRVRARNVNGYGSFLTVSDRSLNYMVGTTSSRMDEDSIPMTGLSSSNRVFLGASFTGNTPAGPLPSTPSSWNSAQNLTAAGYAHEAVVRGGFARVDTTNYSAAPWLPAGPDYTTKESGAQYLTFSWTQTAKSNFSITLTGSYSGLWIGMPGVSDDVVSSPEALGGAWWNAFELYNGAGVPGRSGDAPAGCANGSAATGGTGTVNVTFGTESSTNATNNRVIVRVRLSAGDVLQRVTMAG
jgi:hypothetical protein